MWFQIELVNPSGPPGYDSAIYWGKFPHVSGVAFLITTLGNVPQPGSSFVAGPYELDNLNQWQGMFAQERSHNGRQYPTATFRQVVSYSTSVTGPWTQLCDQQTTGTAPNGFFDLVFCDLRPAFGAATQGCANGTRLKAGQPLLHVVDNALLSAAASLHSNLWVNVLLDIFLGTTVDNGVLCSGAPPSISNVATQLLLNPGRAALEVLYAQIWDSVCECVPGTPPPTPFPPPPWTQPPDWPASPTYPVNPTNPCLDLTEVRAKLDQLLRITGSDRDLDTLMQRWKLAFAFVTGAVHQGLTDSGTIPISRVLGLRIEVVDATPAGEFEGNPPYLKDLGWLSVSDGGAMLQEVRITRGSQDWYPRDMQLATVFGYFAKEGVTLTITELLTEP
jgi:hypothetical protein